MGPLLVSLAATMAAMLPGYASAKVVSRLGQAATGILAEDPSLFGKLVILQALPGTQGIYGLLGWFIIMNQSGSSASSSVSSRRAADFRDRVSVRFSSGESGGKRHGAVDQTASDERKLDRSRRHG